MAGSTLAARLVEARRQHALIEELDARDIPADAGTAYAVQHEVLRLAQARIGAWKIGARSPAALAAGAPIDSNVVYVSPARLPFGAFFRVLVELEIAFRFGRSLPARTDPYTRGEVLEALAGIAVALEVVDSRFAQWPNLDPLAQLADAQNNGALVVGGVEPYEVVAPGFDFLTPRLELTLDGLSIVPASVGNPAGDVVRESLLAHGHDRRAVLDHHDRLVHGRSPHRGAGHPARDDRPRRRARTRARVASGTAACSSVTPRVRAQCENSIQA
jgi:2-keto-4-pentenoate hydratase